MQKNSLHSFIVFGTGFRYLQDVRKDWPFQVEDDADAQYIKANIERFLNFLRDNQMKVSLNASFRLINFYDELVEQAGDKTYRLSEDEAQKLRDFVKDLRIVVLNEAKEVTAFFPTEKRYNIDSLFDDIGLIFGREAFDKAPEFARFDFDEAGKCIVLERGTSAAFHLMRGAECTLKQLYLSVVKRGRMDKPMWGPMVAKLEDRKVLDDALKGTLDNMRRGFRNPVAHPNRIFSVDEAQDLLGTTTQLVGLLTAHTDYDASAI